MATKKTSSKSKQATPPSVSDVPEPQTTVVTDPEKVGEVIEELEDGSKVVVMADSTKSPPQPQTIVLPPSKD